MRRFFYPTFLTILLCLFACEYERDYIYPIGYPFKGNVHELNYRIATKIHESYSQNYFENRLFTNKAECDSYYRKSSPPCNCDEVDFKTENLYRKYESYGLVISGNFDVRLLIDHIQKTMWVETGIQFVSGSTASRAIEYHQWLIIPKLPNGYSFKDSSTFH